MEPNVTFDLFPKEKYDKPFPHFRKPAEIGCISTHGADEKFSFDRTELKFYNFPYRRNVCFDLKLGYDEFISKDPSENIDKILQWILKYKNKFAVDRKQSEHIEKLDSLCTDFICWRGLLTKLACIPYENNDNLKFAVTLFKGTWYLCEFRTEEKKASEEFKTLQFKKMAYWGYKFEQYLAADTPSGKPDTSKPVNTHENFGTVVRSRLNSHSLVFSGEVDAAFPPDTKTDKGEEHYRYVEFKTTALISHPKQEINFKRYKLIKWWLQSFLVGIDKIVCGLRDRDGIVRELIEYETAELPSLAKEIRNPWKPNICLNFLDHVLSLIKKTVTIDDPLVVYLFEWTPGEPLTCRRLPTNSEYCFLPLWYTQHVLL